MFLRVPACNASRHSNHLHEIAAGPSRLLPDIASSYASSPLSCSRRLALGTTALLSARLPLERACPHVCGVHVAAVAPGISIQHVPQTNRWQPAMLDHSPSREVLRSHSMLVSILATNNSVHNLRRHPIKATRHVHPTLATHVHTRSRRAKLLSPTRGVGVHTAEVIHYMSIVTKHLVKPLPIHARVGVYFEDDITRCMLQ